MGQREGKILENYIIQTNRIYKHKGLALVDKIATPWKVWYDPKKKLNRAVPEQKSTVDFVGVSHGRAIAFDTKSTNLTSRFPLDNIEQHQVNYLQKHKDQGGISFFIVHFAKLRETYFLSIDELMPWWEEQYKGGRKSIPYQWFVLNARLIRSRNGVALDYLEHCNTAYKQRKEVHK